MQRIHRFGAMTVFAGIGLTAGLALLIPTSAQSTPTMRPDTTCSDHLPCFFEKNNGTGIAIKGVSVANDGLAGSTTFQSTSPTNFHAGVSGIDQSSTGSNDDGVFGNSKRGYGVFGIGNTGVRGNGAAYGVFGAGDAVGVEGLGSTVSSSIGVLAANLGSGMEFDAIDIHGNNLFTVDGSGNTTSVGTITGGSSLTGVGVLGGGGNGLTEGVVGAGVYGVVGTSYYLGLVAQATQAGYYLIAGFDKDNATKFLVDDLGNVYAHSFNATLLTTRQATSAGPELTTYANQSSTPTVEDFGEGQLVDGRASVAFERAFATTIDRTAGYMVFITPEGDTHGLYVTQKTAVGFVVRENQGGRSTVAFSYRIVARPFGSPAARLPLAAKPIRAIPPPPPHPAKIPAPRPDLVRLYQRAAQP
jgi:hypothetical protein